MQLRSDSFKDGARLDARFALGKPGAPVELADNLSPHLAWRDAPEGTQSFAITLIDIDVPSAGDDVNQTGREVPADLPRVEFVHWLIADIAPHIGEFAEGAVSDGVIARGKRDPFGPPGSVQGKNDYTGWFADDAEMAGDYLGYDGPCPPWNDAIVHRYVFTVHALDVPKLGLAAGFTLAELRAAMAGHERGSASMTALYTLNRRLL